MYQSLFNENTANFNSGSFNDGTASVGKILTSADSVGTFSWSDLASLGVTSIRGTSNQILTNGTSGTNQTGDITLTLPQDISIGSSPTFTSITALINTTSQPNITSVGTLSSLSVAGNITATRTTSESYIPYLKEQRFEGFVSGHRIYTVWEASTNNLRCYTYDGTTTREVWRIVSSDTTAQLRLNRITVNPQL